MLVYSTDWNPWIIKEHFCILFHKCYVDGWYLSLFNIFVFSREILSQYFFSKRSKRPLPSKQMSFTFTDYFSLWITVSDNTPFTHRECLITKASFIQSMLSHSRREVPNRVFVTGGRAAGHAVVHFLLFFLCFRGHLLFNSFLNVLEH